MKTLALVAALALGACRQPRTLPDHPESHSAVQEGMPEAESPREQHQWLQQLVGEWTATHEMAMGPEAEPTSMESTEKVRAIGGLWIVGEGSASFGGTKFTSLLTLGYDTQEETFVGTWIDTMYAHLWTYKGKLDASKKVLTLESEGPAMDGTNKTVKYRDAIELKSPDHKVLTSTALGEDGKWTEYLRVDYRRKR
jgi:hypothetical protein